jgi:hypothetical protein
MSFSSKLRIPYFGFIKLSTYGGVIIDNTGVAGNLDGGQWFGSAHQQPTLQNICPHKSKLCSNSKAPTRVVAQLRE